MATTHKRRALVSAVLSVCMVLVVASAQAQGLSFERRDYDAGLSPQSFAVADLNGDGVPDLAVANYGSNTVSVLVNTARP